MQGDSSCFWLSVHGVKLLFESLLFLEGELALENFRWTERDNLVVFDLYYIVHNERDKCICHFARDDFFAYIAPERKKLF